MVRPVSLVAIVGTLLLGLAVMAYAGQDGEDSGGLAEAAAGSQSLDSKIAALPMDVSVDFVESKLGKPDDVQVFWTEGIGRCDFVYYGGWRLVFTRGKLHEKVDLVGSV